MARPDYTILVSPDSELLLEEIARLTIKWTGATGDWQKVVFWGDEPPDSKFWNALIQQGLFATSRIIIIRKAELWPQMVWKGLNDVLMRPSPELWPCICLEVDMDKGKFKIPVHIQKLNLFIKAREKGWLFQAPPLQGRSLESYVQAQANKRNLTFDSQALSKFCATIMPWAAAINNELDKLAIASKNGTVDACLANIESGTGEGDAFKLVSKLESGNLAAVWEEGANPAASGLLFFLISLLSRELRLFWQIMAGENPWLHPSESSVKRNLANKLGFKGIAHGFGLLADAEWQIKSGQQSVEQVMDMLITDFALLFAGKKISQ